jgi:crotonobetainyl-CoA:carnitine CoA-transferase CaiB-like acyl-CoA transferase
VTGYDHFVDRRFYLPNPRRGFLQPDVPYTLTGSIERRAPEPAPNLGEHTEQERARPRAAKVARASTGAAPLPFEGIRVADFTAFWAGPIVGHFLAMLGAEVIHVESPKYPDAIRGHSLKTTEDDRWWEYSPMFHGPNTNKLGVTIDMTSEKGRTLARRLIAECDVMLENYSPRVMEQWGLDYEAVRQIRPDIVFVRMPAFGLTGPWRDRTGYAQNMEQASGLAWITGFPDGPPHAPNGMCDPLAGTHATAALLIALEHRRETGEGSQVEVAMIGGALNVAAEQVIEYQSYGHLMQRGGNHGLGAPHNLYLTKDLDAAGRSDVWVAIAVETDDQWDALRQALGDPTWARDPILATAVGRVTAQAELDKQLTEWCQERPSKEIVDLLWSAGVPVGLVVAPGDTDLLPHHQARNTFEELEHPLVGKELHLGYPVRFSAGPDRVHRSSAPTLGQHNEEVFGGLLGLSDAEMAELENSDVIGTRLLGDHRIR